VRALTALGENKCIFARHSGAGEARLRQNETTDRRRS
jgi:hypothetical protein